MPVRKIESGKLPKRQRAEARLYGKENAPQLKRDNAEHIMSNANIKRFDIYVFKFLDITNSFISKHSKIGKKITNFCEWLIKLNNK